MEPSCIDIIAAIDAGLGRQVDSATFDGDECGVAVLVRVAALDGRRHMEVLDGKIRHQVKLVIKQQPQLLLTRNGIHRHRRSGRRV